MQNNNITKILQIKGVKITKVEEKQDQIHIYMQLKQYKIKKCPNCKKDICTITIKENK